MCGRYVQTKKARDHARLLTIREQSAPARSETWNLAPSTKSLIVRAIFDDLTQDWYTWGFRDPEVPRSQIPPTNARVETAAVVWLFRDAWRGQRCVIPADGWYEWRTERGGKQPYYFTQKSGHPLFFAGLWTGSTFAILTTAADGNLAEIHDRRPLGLDLARAWEWIQEAPREGESLLTKMLPGEEIVIRPVDPRMNSPKYDGPELLAPYMPPAGSDQLGLL